MKRIIIYGILVLVGIAVIQGLVGQGCSSGAVQEFKKALDEGNLTEAAKCIERIGYDSGREKYALRLIRLYLDVDNPKQAIYVYEELTPSHVDRSGIRYASLHSYEYNACKLLREYLVEHGEYEKAWEYYPLNYQNENYISNAESRYAYLSDVVTAMCDAGQQEEAAQFIKKKLHWFVTYVDTSKELEDYAAYRSDLVNVRLQQIIDDSY